MTQEINVQVPKVLALSPVVCVGCLEYTLRVNFKPEIYVWIELKIDTIEIKSNHLGKYPAGIISNLSCTNGIICGMDNILFCILLSLVAG